MAASASGGSDGSLVRGALADAIGERSNAAPDRLSYK